MKNGTFFTNVHISQWAKIKTQVIILLRLKFCKSFENLKKLAVARAELVAASAIFTPPHIATSTFGDKTCNEVRKKSIISNLCCFYCIHDFPEQEIICS